jgi:hypothetical protein
MSAEIYLSMVGAKQHEDTGFILVPAMGRRPAGVLWQPAQENTVLSPKTDPLWSLSNSKVSYYR